MTKFRVTKDFLLEGDNAIISQSGEGGGVSTTFCRHFMSHDTETFVGETFSVSLFLGFKKFYSQEGYVTILCRKFSVS